MKCSPPRPRWPSLERSPLTPKRRCSRPPRRKSGRVRPRRRLHTVSLGRRRALLRSDRFPSPILRFTPRTASPAGPRSRGAFPRPLRQERHMRDQGKEQEGIGKHLPPRRRALWGLGRPPWTSSLRGDRRERCARHLPNAGLDRSRIAGPSLLFCPVLNIRFRGRTSKNSSSAKKAKRPAKRPA